MPAFRKPVRTFSRLRAGERPDDLRQQCLHLALKGNKGGFHLAPGRLDLAIPFKVGSGGKFLGYATRLSLGSCGNGAAAFVNQAPPIDPNPLGFRLGVLDQLAGPLIS
jgi:hypothetical protein